MRKLTSALAAIGRDFTTFWHIRVPAWLTRASAALPTSRKSQDEALYACAFVAVCLLASGLVG
ncbi:MAG: hypothetical protein IIA02_10615 [Proteobacteria bacterium]|nr:hypothetical protein [Pseudomonadota bacterium]